MGYVVLHLDKSPDNEVPMTAHIARTKMPPNAMPELTYLNEELVEFPEGVADRTEAINHRLEHAGLTRKIGTNQVRVIRVMLTGTQEDMLRIVQEGRLKAWCTDNLAWLRKTFGAENVVSAVLHMDEATPHIHAAVVPIVTGERRKVRKEKTDETGKRKYRTKSTARPRLCADDVMSRIKLKEYQDTYAAAMAKYGLQRGIDGSEARHVSTQQYYRDIKRQTEELKAEVMELQEQKDTAREELARAKKEIQTERLKGAATTAAANIAESVNSLFGSNKVKTLERENTALQNRIIELEEEARQRERQQAKQMQEMKSTYEQQNSKLSEFVNFVKCYFPYVEKLMPTIKFLRDTLHFGDVVIRKLCTFKDVSIKGELYSREFNRHFKTDNAVCSLKQNTEGKFELNIDGISHVSWFRRKKDEFMEALGMPTKKQDRSIKL